MDTIQLINKEVQRVINVNYGEDGKSPVTAVVSIFDESILLTLTHMGRSYSDKIHPEISLESIITKLYNQTM